MSESTRQNMLGTLAILLILAGPSLVEMIAGGMGL